LRTIDTRAPVIVSEPVGTDDRAMIGVFDSIDAARAAVMRLDSGRRPVW